jgi:hypothetical protein
MLGQRVNYRGARFGIILAVIITVVFGMAILLWAPEIFQKGNPLPYLYAASRISDDHPYVYVNTGNDDTTVYISSKDVCQEFLQFIEDSKRVEFLQQAGSVYIFSDGEDKISVNSEIYWGKYLVWTVSGD